MSWFTLTLGSAFRSAAAANEFVTWQLPDDLVANIAHRLGVNEGVKNCRFFSRLGVVAMCSDRVPQIPTEPLAGVDLVFSPPPIAGDAAADWYIRLLAAWDYAIGLLDGYDQAIITMSLSSPIVDPSRYSADEPINRATSVTNARGYCVVVSAGNRGESGDDTMSLWARSDWVVSVAAANEDGQIEPYSSRGIPGDTRVHPTLAAGGMQPTSGELGTSFAAPRVADVAFILLGFILGLARAAKLDERQLRPELPRIVRALLIAMARPIPGAALHEAGVGFVDPTILAEFYRTLTLDRLCALWPPFKNVIDAKAFRLARDGAMGSDSVIAPPKLALVNINTSFEWSIPSYTPGLLHFKKCYMYRMFDMLKSTDDFDVASTAIGVSRLVGIGIEKVLRNQRQLVVNPGAKGCYQSIAEAVASADDWDVVRIMPGTYVETLKLKSRLTLLGGNGVVIRHDSQSPINVADAHDVALLDIALECTAARKPAVWLSRTRKTVFRNCAIRSAAGNGIDAISTQRLFAYNCTIEGGVNGAYAVFSSQAQFYKSTIRGRGTGLLLYDTSGAVFDCSVTADNGDAVFFVPRKRKLVTEELGGSKDVYEFPAGYQRIDFKNIAVATMAGNDLAAKVARLFFGLEILDCRLHGGRTMIATSDFAHLFIGESTTSAGGTMDYAEVTGSEKLPAETYGLPTQQAFSRLNASLRNIHYAPVFQSGVARQI